MRKLDFSVCTDHIFAFAHCYSLALGAKITGCDDQTFSATGDAYSMIVLPNSSSSHERTLQKDDVSLAYDFAKKVFTCRLALVVGEHIPCAFCAKHPPRPLLHTHPHTMSSCAWTVP